MGLKSRIRSFKNAFVGIKVALSSEINLQIHFVAFILVTIAGFLFQINSYEWIAVLGIVALVIAAELFNTAIEKICDHITPDLHPMIKLIKDISAGAVLITAIGALIIACIIFIPKIVSYLW